MKSVFKVFGIILGVIMMVPLFGCEKPVSNKDNDVNANAEVNNIVNKNEPIADVESLDITEEDLINSAVGDNIVFDYYEAVVATVGGNDSEEYVLYTCDYNGYLILIRYETPDGKPEKSYARLVPASTFDDCMKAVKKYKMTKWKDEIGINGKKYVVRFSQGDEYYRITSEAMPENGMDAFDAIRKIMVSAWSAGIKK